MRPFGGVRWRQCHNEPGYFEAFAKDLSRKIVVNVGVCAHRGAHLGDFRCDSCGTPTRPVYRCPLHKRCADIGSTGVRSCRTCADFKPREIAAGRNPVEGIERVYCVNLDRRPERWQAFLDHVAAVEDWPLPEVRRFSATDGAQPDTPAWWNAGGGAWGCRDSHLRILRECLADGVESVLIFEDDAKFPADFGELLRNFLRDVPDDWEVIYLGGQHQRENVRKPETIAPGILRPYNVNRTHAWAFRGAGIAKARGYFDDLDDWSRYPRDHIDHRAGRATESHAWQVYCPSQWFVLQGANKSDIDGKTHGPRAWYRPGQWRPEFTVKPRPGVIRVGVVYPQIDFGGAEVWLKTFIAGLPSDRFVTAGVGVEHYGDGPKLPLAWPITGDLRTVADNADVVVAWGLRNPANLRRWFKGPIVGVSHGGNEWSRQMLRRLAPHCHELVAVSRHAAAAFPASRSSRVIPCGVPERSLPDRAESRQRLGIGDRIAVGFVGRLSDEKDPLAVARAVEVMPDAVAVYCGPDVSNWRITGEITRTVPADRSIMLGRRDDPTEVYAAIDVLLLTSPSEGFGLAIAEAMLAGVPVVCSPTGFVAETTERIATIVPTGADGETLAAAIREAVRGETIEAARRHVREQYSAAAMADLWVELLTSLVHPSAAVAA